MHVHLIEAPTLDDDVVTGSRTLVVHGSDAPGLGFTTGQPWLPFGTGAAELAVDRQRADPTSTLSAYTRLLRRRRALLPELPQEVEISSPTAELMVVRRGPLTVVLNTAAEPAQVPADGPGSPVPLSRRRGLLRRRT